LAKKRFTIFFENGELRSMGWEDLRNPRLRPWVEESGGVQGALAPEIIMVKSLNKCINKYENPDSL